MEEKKTLPENMCVNLFNLVLSFNPVYCQVVCYVVDKSAKEIFVIIYLVKQLNLMNR